MLVNGRFLTRPATGVERFATELLRASIDHGTQVELLVPISAHIREPSLPHGAKLARRGFLTGNAWEQLELPRFVADRPLVNLCTAAPMVLERQVVVIHDASTWVNSKNFSRRFRAWYRLLLSTLARRARLIVTVSRFSAAELARFLPRARIEVIGEGGEHILRERADVSILERYGLIGRRYVLAVGSRSLNKNLRGVMAAMALLKDRETLLVTVGGGNARVFSSNHERSASGRTIAAGYVTNAELRALYEHAACFVFPSLYEGFGLPPVEAMCCGCPVVVSNTSSLPEVCADAALYCDPLRPHTIAAQISAIISDSSTYEELRRAGLARAAQLTWRSAAEQFEALLATYFD